MRYALQHRHLWGVGLASFALGLVNGALVISAGVGWVAYQQLLALSPQQWRGLRQQIEQALPLPRSMRQQSLILGILLGVSTYTMASLWQTTHSPWMAMVFAGQTLFTLLIVGFLLRSGASESSKVTVDKAEPVWYRPDGHSTPVNANSAEDAPPQIDPLESGLAQLSHGDPLKRLVAVRRLVKLVETAENDSLYVTGAAISLRSHLIDCFHIMLANEPEPIVRTAVREGLNLLRQTHQLPEGSPALPAMSDKLAMEFSPDSARQISATNPPASRPRHRSAVEYVEYIEP
jgi:hypothetical protein